MTVNQYGYFLIVILSFVISSQSIAIRMPEHCSIPDKTMIYEKRSDHSSFHIFLHVTSPPNLQKGYGRPYLCDMNH